MNADIPRYRFWGSTKPPGRQPIRAEVAPAESANTATIRLYDPIDSWGGDWGISAKEFAAALDDMGRNIDTVNLLINSPGGEVFEGLAILNALRAHPAAVNVTIEGIAASAASFIAMAGDKVTMARNSQLMIHDASGLVIGNAKDMASFADVLNKMSDNIASVYAERAGGLTSDWREAMAAETWYSADEAVEAGLADSVIPKPTKGDSPSNRFDLSLFAHAGRDDAPEPFIPREDDGPDPPDDTTTDVEDTAPVEETTDATGSPAADVADEADTVHAQILRVNENAALIAFGG